MRGKALVIGEHCQPRISRTLNLRYWELLESNVGRSKLLDEVSADKFSCAAHLRVAQGATRWQLLRQTRRTAKQIGSTRTTAQHFTCKASIGRKLNLARGIVIQPPDFDEDSATDLCSEFRMLVIQEFTPQLNLSPGRPAP